MRKIVVALTLAAGAVAFMAPTEALAWYCVATSRSASGWGSGSYNYAVRRALRECAIRTPRHQTCYIRYCR